MTKTRNNLRNILAAGAAFLLVVLVGCQAQTKRPADDIGFDDDDARPVSQAAASQAAAGARADAMLYACHFDGPALNTLGQAKLRLMLLDPQRPVALTIYLDTPALESAESGAPSTQSVALNTQHLLQSRRESVGQYLRQAGWTQKEFVVAGGFNPAAVHPCVDGITHMGKIESGTGAEQGAATDGAPAVPAAPASGSGYQTVK